MNMDEIMKELAISIAETKRDEITAVFNDYKEYMNVLDIAFIIDEVFHDMIWNIERDAKE
jgi:hypothetical protein